MRRDAPDEDHAADLRFAVRGQCAYDDAVERCFEHFGADDTDPGTALDLGVCRGVCIRIPGIFELEAGFAAHDDLVVDFGEECLDVPVRVFAPPDPERVSLLSRASLTFSPIASANRSISSGRSTAGERLPQSTSRSSTVRTAVSDADTSSAAAR